MLWDLGEPTHILVPCWLPKPLPPRNECMGCFVAGVLWALSKSTNWELLHLAAIANQGDCHAKVIGGQIEDYFVL